MRALATALMLVLAPAAAFGAATLPGDATLVRTDYLTGLSAPTGMRFIGANEGFVIEKAGRVKYFAGGAVSTALDIVATTVSNSERGLLGIALDPMFATNRHVYLYHSTGSGSTNATAVFDDNRVTRYTWNPATKMLDSPSFVRSFGTAGNGNPDGANHNGGVIAFGADGKLYGITGDLNRNSVEQNNKASTTSAFSGGIFRINSDGTLPAPTGSANDNKFSGDFALWHAYGVRNSFGLAFDPVTGNLWDTENGETTFDEINRVVSGMNSGWRPLQGPAGATDPASVLNMLPGAVYQDPKFSFASAIGITSIQFLDATTWGPGYGNAVLVGENNNQRLWLFRLNDDRDDFVLSGNLADRVFNSGDSLTPFGTGFNVTTDIQVVAGDAVYVVTLGDGTVHRIAPIPEPRVWALTLAGLLLVGLVTHRRRTRERV